MEKLLQKNNDISEGCIFSNKTFPNIVINQFSYWIFIKDFQRFLKIPQQFVFFVQTREKVTQDLLSFLKNMLK